MQTLPFILEKSLKVATFVVEQVIQSLYVGYGDIKLDQNIIKLFIKSAVFSLLTCQISSAFLSIILARMQCLKNGRKLSAFTFINNSQAQSVRLTLEVMILNSLLN